MMTAATTLIVTVLAAIAPSANVPKKAAKPVATQPAWVEVQAVVEKALATAPSYAPGDPLTRSTAARALDAAKGIGWNPKDRDAILSDVLADDAVVVRALSTTRGKKLWRDVGRYDQGYDRLERLAALPDGRQLLAKLASGPDGYKLIEYMVKSPGGRELGKMLGRGATPAAFNQPTGHIYTQDELVARLKKSYDTAR